MLSVSCLCLFCLLGGEQGSFLLSASMFLSVSITAGPFNSLRTWGDPTPQDATVNTHPHICTPKTLSTSRKKWGESALRLNMGQFVRRGF